MSVAKGLGPQGNFTYFPNDNTSPAGYFIQVRILLLHCVTVTGFAAAHVMMPVFAVVVLSRAAGPLQGP